MRISRLSSDVCSSDLFGAERRDLVHRVGPDRPCFLRNGHTAVETGRIGLVPRRRAQNVPAAPATPVWPFRRVQRSEEHTSELQSLMRISYAVFCLKKKNKYIITSSHTDTIYSYN